MSAIVSQLIGGLLFGSRAKLHCCPSKLTDDPLIYRLLSSSSSSSSSQVTGLRSGSTLVAANLICSSELARSAKLPAV